MLVFCVHAYIYTFFLMRQSTPTFQQQQQHQQQQPPPPPQQQKNQARPGAPQFNQQAFYRAIPEGLNPNVAYAQFNSKQRPLQQSPQNQLPKMQQSAYAQMAPNGVAAPTVYPPQPHFYDPQSKYPPQIRFMQGMLKGNPNVPQAIAQNNHGIVQNNFQGNRQIPPPQYLHQQAQLQQKKQNSAMLMKIPPSKNLIIIIYIIKINIKYLYLLLFLK